MSKEEQKSGKEYANRMTYKELVSLLKKEVIYHMSLRNSIKSFVNKKGIDKNNLADPEEIINFYKEVSSISKILAVDSETGEKLEIDAGKFVEILENLFGYVSLEEIKEMDEELKVALGDINEFLDSPEEDSPKKD